MEGKELLNMIKEQVGEEKLDELMEIAWQHTIQVALEGYDEKSYLRYGMYKMGVNSKSITFEELMENAPSVRDAIGLINDVILGYYKMIKETNQLVISQIEADNIGKMYGFLLECEENVQFLTLCVKKLVNKMEQQGKEATN